MRKKLHLSFQYKLLFLLLTLSVVPLVLVAFIVSSTVQNKSLETLAKSFVASVEYREKIVEYYLEGNKIWIKSISSQDILLAEMEKNAQGKDFSANRVFASLVSIQRQNQFIEKMYITDINGTIIAATTSDEVGNTIDQSVKLKADTKDPYYINLRTKENKRLITLLSPFIQRNNNRTIGFLVVDYNASAVKSLIDGSIYESSSINQNEISPLGHTYIFDEDGYILTSISGTTVNKSERHTALKDCNPASPPQTGKWKNEQNSEVFGAYICSSIDNIKLLFLVEEETAKAFTTSRDIRNTIVLTTLTIAVMLSIGILKISHSVTNPIKKLNQSAKEMGQENFKTEFSIKSGDEIEDLANTLAEMAKKIETNINDLKNNEDKLSEIDTELAKEKEAISAERNKLEVIAAGITDAIIAVDLNRIVLSCNKPAETLLGLAKEAIIGQEINELFELEDENGNVPPSQFCPIRTDDFEGVVYNKPVAKQT